MMGKLSRTLLALAATLLAVLALPQPTADADELRAVAEIDTGLVLLPVLESVYESHRTHLRQGRGATGDAIIYHAIGDRLLQPEPGGIHDGTIERFNSELRIDIVGLADGPLEGVRTTVILDAECEVHAGPQSPDADLRSLETTMVRLQSNMRGNSADFESFEVVAGDAFGLPSPGHTTLIRQGDGTFLVDSRFDIRFRIRFQATPGGRFRGLTDEIEGKATMIATSNRLPPPLGE